MENNQLEYLKLQMDESKLVYFESLNNTNIYSEEFKKQIYNKYTMYKQAYEKEKEEDDKYKLYLENEKLYKEVLEKIKMRLV
jgi:hypothetical protein